MAISAAKRFLIGGAGGLAPVIALLIAVDFEKNFVGASNAQIAGYVVRAFVLFAVGGFVAWLHESEEQNFKVFEIGLGAPALIAGIVTSQSLAHSPSMPPSTPATSPTAIFLKLIPSALAQPNTIKIDKPLVQSEAGASAASSGQPSAPLKNFSFPEVSGTSEFLEGLIGIRIQRPKDVYYVITGSYRTLGDAAREAARVNSRLPDIQASVYAPFAENSYYAVVLGERTTKAAANELKAKAVAKGLAQDTYLWTTPSLRY